MPGPSAVAITEFHCTGLYLDYVTPSVGVEVKPELIQLPLCPCLFTLFSAFSVALKN